MSNILLRLASAGLVCAAAVSAQSGALVVHESLADQSLWTEPSTAPEWTFGVRAAGSTFARVDRLNSDTTVDYQRTPIRLSPGQYVAWFRHKKLGRTGLEPLTLTATTGGQTFSATTRLRSDELNEWVTSTRLEFVVTKERPVVFRLRNANAATTESGWLFDAFRLEQLRMAGEPEDRLGTAVAGAGDVNGDDIPDFIVGSARSDRRGVDTGIAQVVSGRDLTPLYTFFGTDTGDQFGFSVDGAGDVDGDGYADVVVGIPYDDDAGRDAGSAVVYSGRTGARLYAFRGPRSYARLGWCVRGAGDVNADGYHDVLVSAPSSGGIDLGRVIVYSGRDGVALHTFLGDAKTDWFGWSADGVGDVDRDGHADVLVGAPRDDDGGLESGSVRLFSGRTGQVLFSRNGGAANHQLGTIVAGIGDANADGYPDYLIQSPHASPGGVLECISGQDRTQLWTFSGVGIQKSIAPAGDVNADRHADVVVGFGHSEVRVLSGKNATTILAETNTTTAIGFGVAVAGIGDRDGDGIGEVVVGAPSTRANGRNAGSVHILRSTFATAPRLWEYRSTAAGARDAASASRVGDLDGDGMPEIVVGRRTPYGLGSIRVFSGRSKQVIRWTIGGSRNGEFGTSVAGVGDIDGDGFADYVVGAPHDDPNGTSSGKAYVYSGRSGNLIFDIAGDRADDRLGVAVARAGDVDADGVPDVLVRATTYARVISGRSRGVIRTISLSAAYFHWTASLTGGFDLDRDGHADYAVAQAPTNMVTAWVRVYSGRDGSILRTFTEPGEPSYGRTVRSRRDVNGDGVVDFIVSASGRVFVYSGRDGSKIRDFAARGAVGVQDVNRDGYDDLLSGSVVFGRSELRCGKSGRVLFSHRRLVGGYGSALVDLGDIDGDGRGDYAVGAPGTGGTEGSSLFVFSGVGVRRAPRVWHYGAPCGGATGRLPRMHLSGLPTLGTTSEFALGSAPIGAIGFLAIGSRAEIPLGRCRALVRPRVLAPHVASTPASRIRARTPNSAAFVGLRFAAQWALADPANGQLLTSDGVELVVGR